MRVKIVVEDCGWLDKPHHHHRARYLGFTFHGETFSVTGENMNFTLASGFQVPFTVQPLLSDGVTPSTATLSNLVFSTSGPFTVAPDQTTPNGGILTCPTGTSTGATDTLVGVATATETSGATEQISGSVALTTGPGTTPPPVAASLGFTFGTPVPITAKK